MLVAYCMLLVILLACLQVAAALLAAKQRADAPGWQAFQEHVHALKNRRTRARREAEDLQGSIFAADTAQRLQREGALVGAASLGTLLLPDRLNMLHLASTHMSLHTELPSFAAFPTIVPFQGHAATRRPAFPADEPEGEDGGSAPVRPLGRACRIVLISGFESFNVDLYKKARPFVAFLASSSIMMLRYPREPLHDLPFPASQ